MAWRRLHLSVCTSPDLLSLLTIFNLCVFHTVKMRIVVVVTAIDLGGPVSWRGDTDGIWILVIFSPPHMQPAVLQPWRGWPGPWPVWRYSDPDPSPFCTLLISQAHIWLHPVIPHYNFSIYLILNLQLTVVICFNFVTGNRHWICCDFLVQLANYDENNNNNNNN